MIRIVVVICVMFVVAGLELGRTYAQKSRPGIPDKSEGRTPPRLFAPQDLGLLEPPDREAWQKPDQVMDALHIAEGTSVADLGAGGGWFTVRLARRVGKQGRVFAVDVQRLMIAAIQRRVQREGLGNVEAVLGKLDDPGLPAPVDAVLIVDAFPEMQNPVAVLRNVARMLKPHGRIGIINYREGEGGPGPDPQDRVAPASVIASAAEAGLKVVDEHKFLPYQFFLIFGR